MTRTRALLGALAAGSLSFGLATTAPAQTVNDISGSQGLVEPACLGLLALFSTQDCSYDEVPFTTFGGTWSGPIANSGFYAPGDSPWAVNGSPDVNVVPTNGDNKSALALTGTVTVDPGADTTACTADDTLAASVAIGAGTKAVSGGPGVRYEESWGDGDVVVDLAATTVSSATPNGGGCDYELASLGFPEFLQINGGGTYPVDQDITTTSNTYVASSPVGVARFEGDTDETTDPGSPTPLQVGAPVTVTTGGAYSCIDQAGAACPATASSFAGAYATIENSTWKVSTDAAGNITTGQAHVTNESNSLNLPAWSALVWTFTGTCSSGCGVSGATANDDSASTLQDTSVDIDILGNDTGFTDPVTVAIDTPASNGNVTINGTNPGAAAGIDVTYLPNVGFSGQDTFVYSVVDDGSASDTATVTVDVQANVTPAAPDGDIAVSSLGGATTAGTLDVSTLGGYSAGNTPSTVSIQTNANAVTEGTCSVAGTTVSFTRVTDFVDGGATASCVYRVTDNDAETADGTLTITVTDVQPTLAAGSGSGVQDTDIDASGAFTAGNGSVAQHTLAITTDATNGSCAAAVSGSNVVVTLTPDAGYVGADTCSATLTDSDGDAVEAAFTFDVTAPNNGGGNNGITLPGGKSALDLWSLGLLLGLPLLRRRRQG